MYALVSPIYKAPIPPALKPDRQRDFGSENDCEGHSHNHLLISIACLQPVLPSVGVCSVVVFHP
jgi:hypothetical protein